nr:ankyrin repeat protein [Pandoravirus massiliensis]
MQANCRGVDINTLPDELLGLVFSFLPCVRRRVASCVCTRWHVVAMDHRTAAGPLCWQSPSHRWESTFEHITRTFNCAAAEGHVVCLSHMFHRYGRYHEDYSISKAMCAAARRGQVASIAYLAQRHTINDYVLHAASRAGSAISVRYLCETAGIAPRWSHLALAIASGAVDAVDYLHGRVAQLPVDDEWFDPHVDNDWFKLHGGHPYGTVYQRCNGVKGAYACAIAARHGSIDALAYLVGVGCPLDVNACIEAAAYGHVDCLQYAHEHGAPWDGQACAAVAVGTEGRIRNASAACIVYALANGCPARKSPSYVAAQSGDLAALRRAHGARCPWDAGTTAAAAGRGHRACLYYAHEHGCPWDSRVCMSAAASGALKILTYAHRHGCPYDVDDLIRAATRGGQRWCLDYIKKYMQ